MEICLVCLQRIQIQFLHRTYTRSVPPVDILVICALNGFDNHQFIAQAEDAQHIRKEYPNLVKVI